jgi:hypothetical protein
MILKTIEYLKKELLLNSEEIKKEILLQLKNLIIVKKRNLRYQKTEILSDLNIQYIIFVFFLLDQLNIFTTFINIKL